MKIRMLRLIGKILAFIGTIIFLLAITIFIVWTTATYPLTISEILSNTPAAIVLGFFPLGFILTSCGVIILRRFEERVPFLDKDGEPIHSGKPWKQGSESGLFLTSCGLVVSINQESRMTAHVGYKIVPAKRATHRDCILKEGGIVLDSVAKRRGH